MTPALAAEVISTALAVYADETNWRPPLRGDWWNQATTAYPPDTTWTTFRRQKPELVRSYFRAALELVL